MADPPVPLDPEIARLVAEIVPQARAEAWKMFQSAPHALELDELISLAYQGLAQAAARWAGYCEKHGYSPQAYHYFGAYATRRIRGSMLDAMRSSDWVTRSVRSRAKALREAGLDQGKSEAELAETTGLSITQIRETLAGMSRKPVSMDAEPVDVTEVTGVEGQAVVNGVLAAVAQAVTGLSDDHQLVLACHYYAGKDLREVAQLLEVAEVRVAELHAEAVAAVHEAMILAVRD